MFMLLAIIFGFIFIIRGIQKIFALVSDLRTGVQKIDGELSVSMQHKAKASVRGVTSFSIRYYLHVRPHQGNNDSVIVFPISHNLYQIIQSHDEDSSYTVYYLTALSKILSLEKF